MYGIDNSKQLRKLTAAGIYSINLGTGTLEDTPVSIINRKDLNALIVVTKNSFTLQYVVTIVNTLNDKKTYSKAWPSTAYNGNFMVDFNSDGKFVLIRQTAGFLLLLTLDFVNSVAVTEVTL